MASPLDELEKIVSTCTSCDLHCTRTQTVFSRGNPSADLMIVGEAPGKNEDKQGYPFVGKAGEHLGELLRAAGVPEDQVYYCNVLKCRPPDNRFPEGGDQPEICRQYLLQQIDLVAPKAIVLAGKQALHYVLLHGTTEECKPFTPWTNKIYRRKDLFGDTRLLVVYHPAYLIRRSDKEDEEGWVQSISELWTYVKHKERGTPPAPLPFREIRPAPEGPQQRRNLFSERREDVL